MPLASFKLELPVTLSNVFFPFQSLHSKINICQSLRLAKGDKPVGSPRTPLILFIQTSFLLDHASLMCFLGGVIGKAMMQASHK